MKKIYVIDVSGYLFRAFYALPPMSNHKGQATSALYGFVRAMMKLVADFSPEYVVAVFDGPDGKKSRTAIYPEYKAKRQKIPEDLPQQIDEAERFCALYGIPTLVEEGVEADDTIGSVTKWAEKNDFEVFLCSSDKDLGQLINQHVVMLQTHKDNAIIDEKGVQEQWGVHPEQMVDYLAIVGDSSDNIPGVAGLGPKSASDLLEKYGTLKGVYQHLDEIKGKKGELLQQHKELAFLSYKLATINTAVAVPKTPLAYARKPSDEAALDAFFEEMNFRTLIKKKSEAKSDGTKVKIIDSIPAELYEADVVAFDCETDGKPAVEAEIIGIGFSCKVGHSYYMPWNADQVRPLFEKRTKPFVAHNAKFDLHVIANYDIRPKAVVYDTMIASYLLFSEERQHSLDTLSGKFLDRRKGSFRSVLGEEKTLHTVPVEKVAAYCGLDADLTLELHGILMKQIKKRGLEKLLEEMELPILLVLLKMERAGIYVDAEDLALLSRQVVKQLNKAEKEIFAEVGHEFNLNSPKQLAEALFDTLQLPEQKRTGTGQRSTSIEVLETLAIESPIVDRIVQYRQLEKLRSTYTDSLPEDISPKDGRVHPSFNQGMAATGRLSCQDPNLQNIPVRSELGREIRAAFKPQKRGWRFLSADYSQIELRMLAHMSEDPALIKAFHNDEDIHAFTASLIFNTKAPTKEQRQAAKVVNFGVIYGQQAYGLSRELKCSPKEAALFIDLYFARYPRVREFLEECKKSAHKTGFSVTMSGRQREMKDIHSKNVGLRAQAERFAINTPIQGSAADLMKEAMLRADELLTKRKLLSFMVLQIHDELLFEIPAEEEESMVRLAQEAMQVVKLKVPLKVDVAVGRNWKECYS